MGPPYGFVYIFPPTGITCKIGIVIDHGYKKRMIISDRQIPVGDTG